MNTRAMPGLSDDPLVARAAALVLDAFEDYEARFGDLTRRARRRFVRRDWVGAQRDAVARIDLADAFLGEALGRFEALAGERMRSRSFWAAVRDAYGALTGGRPDAALARTLFNSMSRRFFLTEGVAPSLEFHDPGEGAAGDPECPGELRPLPDGAEAFTRWRAALGARGFAHRDLDADARAIAEAIAARVGGRDPGVGLLDTVFYRERRAYLVGRIDAADGPRPLVVALVNDADGVRADALLTEHAQVSMLFGHARSWFHADLRRVGDAVAFLKALLPAKPVSELYSVLGRGKQGKTERYREIQRHFATHPEERLVRADGVRGMVMAVFTPRALPVVFKVIRDRFAEPKDSVRADIEAKYRLVARRDRVGRLVEAQEFRRLRFPRAAFAPDMLDELLGECAETVSAERDMVLVRHCYVERRLRPLDLYAREMPEAPARHAVIDYGQAVTDLARSGIFPGDLLLKNFGVSRNGRALFYDFDELCLLEEVNFREVPEAHGEDETRPLQDWLYAHPADVFPELFTHFLGLSPALRQALLDAHPGVFQARWWRGIQARLRNDGYLDVPPYPESARLGAPGLSGTARARSRTA
ncbi:bifunctional isocitrate dehydrogenase kinase/phosphatase [Luteimonas granuli]|uniref:Isocitrate dehydrogenase kinase/phosphatase n=1 Tax=Luteimonas granuli TaxID=1176533 RepID=A0A518N4C8_9GAMM|nr:bifunctional isocitrate dehydrogenase kinase/phosphatase [Luteimonas granuli]QDW66771.1 bifunctional isocitrate dehydrogenase kinase/phosphatase [Luteimonas granuli]